jgi:16S rRNA G966 N2-methylase RsmD
LLVLCEHIADESIHLIYLDPPFKSKPDYDLLSLGLSLKDVRTSNVSE